MKMIRLVALFSGALLLANCSSDSNDDDANGSFGGTGGGTADGPLAQCVADTGLTGACPECACENCGTELAACTDSACAAILQCGVNNGCRGIECYCGDGADCFEQATGPCVAEIGAASGLVGGPDCPTADACALQLITLLAEDAPANPVKSAFAASLCAQGDGEMNMGACEAECN